MHRARCRQAGLTLVELMVAITISLILIAGVSQIYLSTKQSFRMNDSASRMQENGRFAIEFLARDLRMADFWGCTQQVTQNDVIGGGGINIGLGGLSGTDGTGLNGSDTIRIQGAYGAGITVTPPYMPTPSSDLHISGGSGLNPDDIVIVSDCKDGDIFQITNTNPSGNGTNVVHNAGNSTPGNKTGDLSKSYGSDGEARLYRVRSLQYYLQNNANGEPALIRDDGTTQLELVDGVEDMQIWYGEDTTGDGTADRYLTAASAGVLDFERVVSVRVHLLLRSYADNIVDSPQTYTYDGNSVTAGDRRLRQAYTTTVTIRSRAP